MPKKQVTQTAPAVPPETVMSEQRARVAAPWIAQAKQALLGRKIVDVRWMGEGELENTGWCSGAIVLQLDDGSIVLPQADPEGNGPGSLLHITTKGDNLFGDL